MTEAERNKCHTIIHSTSVIAGSIGAGLAQIPTSDNILLIPLQVGMIISLGAVFSIELNESAARATLATTTATTVGRGLSQVLCGMIPIIGNAINAITASLITETIGWAVAKGFSTKARIRDSKIIKRKGALKHERDQEEY